MNRQINYLRGFTLIEVVMIIVILIILAAIAIPRFVDLSAKPQTLATQRVANNLSSANVINSAACNRLNNVVTSNKCIAIRKCSDIAPTITPALELGAPGPAIINTFNLAADTQVTTNGEEALCSLQYLKDGIIYTASFTITGTGF